MKCPNPKCECELVLDNSIKEWKCPKCGFHDRFPFPDQVMQKPNQIVLDYVENSFKRWEQEHLQTSLQEDNPNKRVDNKSYEREKRGVSLEWGSDQPGHLVFLIDLSETMLDKIDYSIDAVYKTCKSIVTHCNGKERMSISMYGYNYKITELLEPNTSAKKLTEIVKRVRATKEPMFDKEAEAKPQYQTRMQLAFETAKKDVEKWIKQQELDENFGPRKIPAPIVINVTDGHPYEGADFDQNETYSNTLRAAENLMALKTLDGNVRLFNIHHDPSLKDKTVRFPTKRPVGDKAMEFLFDASSVMPIDMFECAKELFPEASTESRCMISNEKEVNKIIQFLEWGSSK